MNLYNYADIILIECHNRVVALPLMVLMNEIGPFPANATPAMPRSQIAKMNDQT